MKKFYVFAGNYGSGKTEISLNTALMLSKKGKTALCDLDIVNPYFRSAEQKEMLEENGIRLIAPQFANTTVDVPSLSAEVQSAFLYDYAVFDAGGDPVGATVLGSFKKQFEDNANELNFYYVINARRPFQTNIQDALEMLVQIEANARMKVHALINNTNLSKISTVEDLIIGEELCAEITKKTGIPVAFTSGKKEILDSYCATGYEGETFPINIYTHPEWMDAKGFDEE